MATATVPYDPDQEAYFSTVDAPYQALERLSQWTETATDGEIYHMYTRIYKRLFDRMGGVFDYPTAVARGYWQLLQAGKILANAHNERIERAATKSGNGR